MAGNAQTVALFGALLYADVKLVVAWVVLCPALLQTALALYEVLSLSTVHDIFASPGVHFPAGRALRGCLRVEQRSNIAKYLQAVGAGLSPKRRETNCRGGVSGSCRWRLW